MPYEHFAQQLGQQQGREWRTTRRYFQFPLHRRTEVQKGMRFLTQFHFAELTTGCECATV